MGGVVSYLAEGVSETSEDIEEDLFDPEGRWTSPPKARSHPDRR
jgi:hypothetical protein